MLKFDPIFGIGPALFVPECGEKIHIQFPYPQRAKKLEVGSVEHRALTNRQKMTFAKDNLGVYASSRLEHVFVEVSNPHTVYICTILGIGTYMTITRVIYT